MNFEAEIVPEVVMIPCRGYKQHNYRFTATDESFARVAEAANYRYCTPGADTLFLASGWYGRVASRGRTPAPPEGISEAGLAMNEFRNIITYRTNIYREETGHSIRLMPRIATDARSVDSITHFTEGIVQGHLQIGGYSPKNPLVLSASQAHSWRLGVIAEQALALEPGSIWRLKDSGLETSPSIQRKERLLLAVTRLALADVGETGGAEPGNLQHTKAAAEAFEDMTTNIPVRTLRRALTHRHLWVTTEVPQLAYAE